MENIRRNIRNYIDTLPPHVKLVAVSKFHPAEAISIAYDAGQRIFGESRANELVEKAKILPSDIQWHFIGHLQTNKVRAILPFVALVHSVDSQRLLSTIDDESKRIGRVTDVLLQVHVAQEETKFGFMPDELLEFVGSGAIKGMNNVRICGVMGMATNTDDVKRIEADFVAIRQVYDALKASEFADEACFEIVSMGMSDDYQIAIKHGSNMVRIGSSIFGVREY